MAAPPPHDSSRTTLFQAIVEVNAALIAMRKKQNSPTPPGHLAIAGLDYLSADHTSELRIELGRIEALHDARAQLLEDAHVLACAFETQSPSTT